MNNYRHNITLLGNNACKTLSVLSVVVAHIQAQGWDYAETSFAGNDITVILPGYSPVTDKRYFCSAAQG